MSIEKRIAAIVVNHHPDPTTNGETCMCGWDPAKHLSADTYEQHVAQALTTELGLTEEHAIDKPGHRGINPQRRYVTPWETT